MSNKSINTWIKSCLHKKRLSEGTADNIIERVKREENLTLYKYYCPHCFHWHLTRKPNNNATIHIPGKRNK